MGSGFVNTEQDEGTKWAQVANIRQPLRLKYTWTSGVFYMLFIFIILPFCLRINAFENQ